MTRFDPSRRSDPSRPFSPEGGAAPDTPPSPFLGPETTGPGGSLPPWAPRIDPAASGDLRFAKLLGLLGLAILALSGLLMALPVMLGGSLLLYVIADGTALLFGPVGFSLLAAAWRIRNRAVHGIDLPPSQRRKLRLLGVALVGVGLFLAFSGFGASGPLSSALNLIWGLSLALVGVRYLFRSFLSAR